MEKEKVEVLVRNLMEKLHIKNRDLDDIMRCYTADGYSIPIFKNKLNAFLGKESEENDEIEDDEFPESARKVYFPWIDVIGSMVEHPEDVRYTETVCPDCGEKLLLLEF